MTYNYGGTKMVNDKTINEVAQWTGGAWNAVPAEILGADKMSDNIDIQQFEMMEQFQKDIAVELEELKALTADVVERNTFARTNATIYTDIDLTGTIIYPNSIQGVDISRWQVNTISPPGTFNFDKLADQGKRFVIYRATVGDNYGDPRLIDYVEHNHRVSCAGYYAVVWLDWGRDVVTQARYFLSKIAGLQPARPWIDLEGSDLDISQDQAAEKLIAWLDVIQDATGFIPGIYTSQLWFDKNIAPSSSWQRYPLWVARYPYPEAHLESPWGDGKYKFRDWDTWTLWQYTDKGDGIAHGAQSYQIDIDKFNGDEAAFAAFMSKSEPVPAPVPTQQYVTVSVSPGSWLNVRNGPGAGYSDLGDLKAGISFPVLERSGVWIRIGVNAWICSGPGLAIID